MLKDAMQKKPQTITDQINSIFPTQVLLSMIGCLLGLTALGHSRPSHPAPMPTDVRYATSSDQNIAALGLVAMCLPITTAKPNQSAAHWCILIPDSFTTLFQ